MKKFAHKPLEHPVIVLCDNDDGCKSLFNKAKSKAQEDLSIDKSTTDPFYHITDNLYLIKIPENGGDSREIEDLFEAELLNIRLDGKPFNRKKEHGDETAYGKAIFAEKVVRPNWTTIDFSAFSDLLSRIEQCITHYAMIKASSPTSAVALTASGAS